MRATLDTTVGAWKGSNLRLRDYESPALTTELRPRVHMMPAARELMLLGFAVGVASRSLGRVDDAGHEDDRVREVDG
jgi:hypothetical protein